MSFENNFIMYSFPKINVSLNDKGVWKKKPVGLLSDWSSLTKSRINKQHECYALLTGKKSDILVLDFDDKKLYDNYIIEFPELSNSTTIKTRNGFHIYFKWNDKYEKLPSKIDKLDIQGNNKQVFAADTKYKLETGEEFKYKYIIKKDLQELPSNLFDKLLSFKKEKKNKNDNLVINTNSNHNTNFCIECNDQLWKEIINNISIKYIDEYQSWFQIICGLYSIGNDNNKLDLYKEYARELSMKSKLYDKTHKEFETKWEYLNKYHYTAGSVRHYSRISNEKKYLEICKKYVGNDSDYLTFDEKLLCNYFIECYGDSLICNFEKIYIYHNNKWINDIKGLIIQKFLKDKITELYQRIISNLNFELQNTIDNELQQLLTNKISFCCKILNSYGFQKNKNIYGLILCELYTRNINVELFDVKKNYFVFTNKAYDFDEKKWININKFDYIITTCDKEYIEPTKDKIDKINEIFDDIFPNKEFKKSYLSILKHALTGYRLEKFIVCTGGGRNGKGVIHDFFQYLLGDYYGILHLSLLTKEIKSGANSELRNIHKKRFLKSTEPDSNSNEKLRMSNIKAFTGESSLKARGLYENDFNIQINATQVLECNKLPFISSDGNEAEKQRIVIIPFERTFTDNKYDIENDPINYKQQKKEYKEDVFYKEYYCALFKYIIDSSENYEVYISNASLELALTWLLDKDDFAGWFFENYKKDDNNIISIKDIYNEFKVSSFFYSMSKTQQRQNNFKHFKETTKSKLKHIYKNRDSYFNKVKINYDAIVGYSKKMSDDSEDDD